MRGKFIVVEGIDGSGKSTQVALLKRRLRSVSLNTEQIHLPQHGSRSAAMVDDYLNGKYGKVSPKVASMFYAIDRFDAAIRIRRWLERGVSVISDRWVTSNAAHQGEKLASLTERKAFYKWLKTLEYDWVGLPIPDLTVVLDMPFEIAGGLIEKKHASGKDRKYSKRKKDHHERDREHLRKAQAVYRELPRYFVRMQALSCVDHQGKLKSRDQISDELWQKIKRFFK